MCNRICLYALMRAQSFREMDIYAICKQLLYINWWKSRPNVWQWDAWHSGWVSGPGWSWQSHQGWVPNPDPSAGGQQSSHSIREHWPTATQSQPQQGPQNPAGAPNPKRPRKNPPTIQRKVYSSMNLSHLVKSFKNCQYKHALCHWADTCNSLQHPLYAST